MNWGLNLGLLLELFSRSEFITLIKFQRNISIQVMQPFFSILVTHRACIQWWSWYRTWVGRDYISWVWILKLCETDRIRVSSRSLSWNHSKGLYEREAWLDHIIPAITGLVFIQLTPHTYCYWLHCPRFISNEKVHIIQEASFGPFSIVQWCGIE